MAQKNNHPITLDDLAVMIASGFAQTASKEEVGTLKEEMGALKVELKQEIKELRHEVEGLKSNVNNYLELSERRYFELKHRDALLAKWIKRIADKVKVPLDLGLLEKV